MNAHRGRERLSRADDNTLKNLKGTSAGGLMLADSGALNPSAVWPV
jgi:hypothetical protein